MTPLVMLATFLAFNVYGYYNPCYEVYIDGSVSCLSADDLRDENGFLDLDKVSNNESN